MSLFNTAFENSQDVVSQPPPLQAPIRQPLGTRSHFQIAAVAGTYLQCSAAAIQFGDLLRTDALQAGCSKTHQAAVAESVGE